MGKIKVRKDVAEQMTSKLQSNKTLEKSVDNAEKMAENDIFNADFAQNRKNQQVTSKLQSNKNIFSRGDFDDYKISDEELKNLYIGLPEENIQKSNPYPRQEGGKWGYKPDLVVRNHLSKTADKSKIDLESLPICKLKDFEKQVDYLYNNNYQQISEITRLPNLNARLAKQMGLGSIKCFYTKKQMIHSRPQRKSTYNQDLRIDEFKRIPIIIHNSNVLYWDKRNKNFFIPFMDRQDSNKVNKIAFYKDVSGNYAVTTSKVYLSSFNNKDLIKVGVGVAPTIHKSIARSYPITRLSVSPTYNKNISQQSNLSSKNVIKSLTYSGHKLQGRTKLYGMDISIENKKGSYRSGTDKDGHKWRTYMNYDYGYIRGTEGVDSDQVDVYIGPDKEAQKVYIIHQNDPVTHKYDEDKCMLCFSSAADAKAAYMKQYDRPGFYGSMTTMTIDQFKTFIFSHKGKMVHKSFDIQITDITENNKQQKLEQFNKALNAIANNQPFVIKHIPADNSKRYENLTVRLMDFDRSKIEKAVHKVALSLDADISGASKGESFVYKSQEEIVDKYFREFTNRTRAVYNFVISYFDLPDIRIVSKAGELKYKGKILYNPETGLPIKESEWKKFIVELEKFLNRNYDGIGEKIVLSAESLGIILDRLSKTNSLEAIRKMSVADLKAKRYDVDWISESVKNMKDKFGDVISRERQGRIQIACDSAAQRVTRVKDDMRNNIQQIIIDGIRDKQSKSVVAQNLFDKCASLNRDMQRIADSEVQMASNSSYCKEEVYNSEPGSKVYFKRFEMIDDNTCKQCKKLNGTIVLWSDVPLPDEHIKDPFAKYAIWEGKNEGSCPVGIVHPYCYSDDTEVMTNNGWKLFKDVEKNDKIMSINPETKEIDFVPYVQKIQYEYNGDMIHFPGRNFDMLVTPDHNMLYLAGNGHGERQLKGIKASELIKNSAFALPRAMGEWKHTDAKTVKLGDLTISKAQYFRLWAWYLAEGSGRLKNGHYEVKLAQKEPIKIYNDLPELQSILHINSDCVCLHGDYARYFECMFGIYADKKFIPPFIKNSSVENIREFLDAFVMADGTRLTNHKCSSDKSYSEFRNEQVLRTSSKKMADDLCELIVKAGWLPSEYVVQEKGKLKHFDNGDYVLNTDCHNISICKSKTRTYAPDIEGHKPRHKPAYEKYNGMVYDVELEKWHFLLVRRNGKCGWSGNCRGSWVRYYPDLD